MSNDGQEQVKLYSASKDILRDGREPIWQFVQRCSDTDSARETVKALKNVDGRYTWSMFRAVRIRDSTEMFNDFIK